MIFDSAWAMEPQQLEQYVSPGELLNIGCGNNHIPNFINQDREYLPGIDMVCDLEQPLPFKDDTFNGIYASHVMEHIMNLEDLVNDLIRISRDGSIWEVHSPVGRERLEIIDHKRIVTDMTFRNWFKSWPSHDAHVLNMRENVGCLELAMKPYYNRDLHFGPISAYHFRKYLGIEPPGHRSQMVIVLRVRK